MLKEWFKSPKRNKEALESLNSPKSFCDFYDKCTTVSKRNCSRCLRMKIIKRALKKMSEDEE